MPHDTARFHPLALLPFALALGCTSNTATPDGPDAATSPGVDAQANTADASLADDAVPTDGSALFVYLKAGEYLDFAAEPAAHASAGPHGQQVRSFFNSALDRSLRDGASAHPVGSAVVKELLAGGVPDGWAVLVKTGPGTSGADWYFYEVLSAADGTPPVADGNDAAGCAGCHADGNDFIRSTYP